MIEEDNNLVKKINQIKQRLQRDMEALHELKQTASAGVIVKIEAAETHGWQTVMELEAVQKTVNRELSDEIERNTILHRTGKPRGNSQRIKCGNIWI